MPILPHGIETDNILDWLCFERSILILRPRFLLWFPIFPSFSFIFSNLFLIILPVDLFLSLIFFKLVNSFIVCDGIVVRIFEQAGIVFKFDCHVGSEPWDLVKMHFWLTYYFINNDVLQRCPRQFHSLNLFLLTFSFSWWWGKKLLVCDPLILLKNLIYQKGVFRVCIAYLNLRFSFWNEMSLVIIVFSEALAESFDGFVKFTYVN